MPFNRMEWNCSGGSAGARLQKTSALLCCVFERGEFQQKAFWKCEILYVCLYRRGRDGEQTWLTVWISSCCKSASVTDGRPLIAGLWRLGSHRRRKSLSVSLGGWEGEGWGCLRSHQSLSPVCVDTEVWVFKGEAWFWEGCLTSTLCVFHPPLGESL